MERPLDETASALERLSEEVKQLECRVRALEDRASQPLPSPSDSLALGWQPAPGISPSLFAGLIQAFGKAVLGVGGAYLLRAAAESGTVPWGVGAAAALIYAALWLYSSARTRPNRYVAGIVYAGTAALILSPMLWETTVRFKILPPTATAGLLAAFASAGAAVAWFRDRPGVIWVTILPATATAMLLIVASGEVAPFAVTLLMACAVVEVAAFWNKWLGIRPCVALLADIGVWLSISIAAHPVLEAYRPVPQLTAIGLGLTLLGIYTGSVGLLTIWLRKRIILFEIAQLAVVYIIAIAGMMRLTQGGRLVGVFCLLIAAASYFVGFHRFSPNDHPGNHHVYAFQGLAFVLTGSALLASGAVAAMLWSGIALAALAISRQKALLTLALHGAISLAASVVGSGLLNYGHLALTGAIPPDPAVDPWIVAIAAIAAYVLCPTAPLANWPRLAIACMASFGAAALLVTAVAAISGRPVAAPWLAALRTLVASSIALLAGFAGSRWTRSELIWIGYATVALVTLKLFWEDLPHSSTGALAVSLLSYGAILLFGPRLIRARTQR